MVARIETGKSIRGVLVYNEKKVEASAARLLFASGFPMESDMLSFRNKVDFFKKFTRQNIRTKSNTLHITLNFSPKDRLDNDKLIEIAKAYMEGIGFGAQPFLVYQHFDAAHPHLHIATVNIANGGERIETHNLGKTKSEKTRKELEVTYGLIRAEDQKVERSFEIKAVPLERVVYGKAETKKAVSWVVREVVGSYKFCSLTELNAVLNQFGVYVDGGVPGSPMHNNGGLIYGLLDQDKQKVGIPIKASSIYSSPTLKNLKKLFVGNKMSRKPYGQRLKYILDKALERSSGLADIEKRLHDQGIRVIFRKNIQGNIFGVTFIDNTTRAVFNGSDLGKKYSAKAFLEALQHKKTLPVPDGTVLQSSDNMHSRDSEAAVNKDAVNSVPGLDLPVIETLVDTLFYDEHEVGDFVPDKKKRRKMQLSR
ncbi:Relaxase/Mobilisation nuclease domain-containing protein [Arachidicoccus rhizosphaerae]|uniref:Relaxase/Mobilisation nuclease domain-containing protein n=1 Tax=Arachidicoccus rhizosphaerae TaxID=551991 RepID=A0A1H3YUJ7_9BACT|nr:relaxase/mobilization nuclease domain-containing protein [Arachidicoccus rhizosphaerae]SEA14758.1 Relaxase/Mobilisation nuclease domain-containing protein [Arachidicoccus rhizosphaerae]